MTDEPNTLTPEEVAAMELGQVPNGVMPGFAVATIETRSAATVGGVDFGERIITVIAVPYEQPTPVPYQREVWNEVFSRSAFNGIETRQKRVPATACFNLRAEDHEGARVVGRAQAFFPSRDEGLVTDLKISRTPAGDEVLALADDGAMDVSVGFAVKNRLDQILDRPTRTRRINRAFLDHIAFVAQPAYTGAKVLAMRSENSTDVEPSGTPLLDQFIEDDILRWANERKR